MQGKKKSKGLNNVTMLSKANITTSSVDEDEKHCHKQTHEIL
jgi:hypothetical protein